MDAATGTTMTGSAGPSEHSAALRPFEPLSRPRVSQLIARLARFPVAVLIAPPGFGKSVALRTFLAERSVPHALYRLRPTLGVAELVRDLWMTIARSAPGTELSCIVESDRALRSENPAREFARWANEQLSDSPMTVVIDELHGASGDPATLDLLAAMVEGTHRILRWILASRSHRDLPMNLWLAHGIMGLPIDETQLALTRREAVAVARRAARPIPETTASRLHAITGGWPAAFVLGVSLRAPPAWEPFATVPRHRLHDAFAARIYRERSDAERAFLLQTAAVPPRDASSPTVDRCWLDLDPGRSLLATTSLLEVDPDGAVRYAPLFHRFLLRRLDKLDAGSRRAIVRRAADVLAGAGRCAEALALLPSTGETGEIARLLERRGFALIDENHGALVDQALRALPDDVIDANATLTALRAICESNRGHGDVADALFDAAIERAADERARAAIVHRRGLDLVRRGRVDGIAVLEPYAEREIGDDAHRAAICATLATACTWSEQFDRARALIDRALATVDAGTPEPMRARILHQAAFVALLAGDVGRARELAQRAIALAREHGGPRDVIARAHSVLYNIAREVDDDPARSVEHLNRIAALGPGIDHWEPRLWALLAAFEIEAERGNAEALTRIESAMDGSEIVQYQRNIAACLRDGAALRAAWSGEFERAYRQLLPSAAEQLTSDRRALRWAEVAGYAAAAELGDEARRAVDAARAELQQAQQRNRQEFMARVHLALALLLLGRLGAASVTLDRLEAALPAGHARMRSAVRAIRALVGRHRGDLDVVELRRALNDLRAHHLGGIALLIEALPLPPLRAADWSAAVRVKAEDRGG